MEFKNYKNMLERPFYVLVDSECTAEKTDGPNKVAKHVVTSSCFSGVCTYDSSKKQITDMCRRRQYEQYDRLVF